MHLLVSLLNRLVDVFGIFFVVFWFQGIQGREHFNSAFFCHKRADQFLPFAEALETTIASEMLV